MLDRNRSRRGGGKTSAAVAVLAIVLAGAAAGWLYLNKSTPEQSVEGFLAAMQSNDHAKAQQYLTEGSQSQAGLLAAMGGAVGGKLPEGQPPAWSVGQAVISGDTATVPVKVSVPDSPVARQLGVTNLTMQYALRKVDGQWKVDFAGSMKGMVSSIGR